MVYKPYKWEREYMNEQYKKLGIPIPKTIPTKIPKTSKRNKKRNSLLANARINALRKASTPGLSSKEIRDILKPFTNTDQFGHPTGSLRGV